MTKLVVVFGFLAALITGCHSHSESGKKHQHTHIDPKYGHSHDWFNLPEGLEHFGGGHGDVAVDSKGLLYVSVETGDKAGIQVYDLKGNYSHNVANAPADFHGFIINEEEGEEFIYGAGKSSHDIFKMDLKGRVILKIPGESIPVKYKRINKKLPQQKPSLLLTSTAVAPNGDIYAVDGYGLDFIHHFDKKGNYLKTFGGREAPYEFKNCHNITMDHRFSPPRILCCVRGKGKLVHLNLNGDIIGDYLKDLKGPSSIAFYGDNMAIAEIGGRVSVFNKAGKMISVASYNPKKIWGNKAKPSEWEPGVVHAPHGIVYDKDGNLFVTEYNMYGRVQRFELKEYK